jgi:citrate/tricarballylate utilization protein
MHGTSTLAEADRLMGICNSCRYCEGLCAVFPAMELRRAFPAGDLNYLANLCHGCGACYFDCQFSPPHEFDVNVPKVFAELRAQSYKHYARPKFLEGLFDRNGLAVSAITSLSVAVFIAGFAARNDPSVLFGQHQGPGSFYRLMPHHAMALLFGAAFVYAIAMIALGVRAFWRSISSPPRSAGTMQSLWQATRDAARLRYLDGGGVGCMNHDERPTDRRRLYHHLTFYGFLLCFMATTVATVYHYALGREAPYPWYDLPVVLGSLGGFGLLIGPAGLLAAKWRRHPDMQAQSRFGMDAAFLVMLFLTSLSGFALLFGRESSGMGILLSLHLGVVFGFFVTMPYGNFVHGFYRFAALIRHAQEQGGSKRT